MSLAEKALSTFRQAPIRHNCCQCVVAAVSGNDAPIVAQASSFGGGNAPDGACGAAHAVMMLRPDLTDEVKKEFNEKAHSYKCKEIKGRPDPYSCQNCVSLACGILEKNKK